MKKLVKLSLVLAVAALVLSGCNCFKKMAKNREDVKVIATPELLVLNNGKIAVDVKAEIPAKYFHKKASVRVTPALLYEGGVVLGETILLQGEKVLSNGILVKKGEDLSLTRHIEFDYQPGMEICELKLIVEIKCKKCKSVEYDKDSFVGELLAVNGYAAGEEKNCSFMLVNTADGSIVENTASLTTAQTAAYGYTIAKGLNTLQKDINYGEMSANMANNYKRVTTVVNSTDLLYAVNSAKVTKKNEKKANFDAFKADVDEKLKNDRATQNITVKGYASPEGPVAFNDKLSGKRSESGKAVVAKLLKDSGLDIDVSALGEDWDGFKELVEKSNIKDKNLILQVLSLYTSSVQRENEIKNMSAVYKEIATEILPELRRAQVVNSTDIQGKTDAEIMAAIKNGGDVTVEEYLFAAENLAKDAAEQVSILTAASKKYGKDARVWNNLGKAQLSAGDAKGGLESIKKAASIDSSKEIVNNLIMANLANGNTAEAAKYAAAADNNAKAAVAAATGDYAAAAKNMSGYNKAVACVMNNELAAAKSAIANDNSAKADYLRAQIASMEGDANTAAAQLKAAISKDASLAQKAAKDVYLKDILK